MMDPVIKKIRQKLREGSDEELRRKGEYFFREDVKLYGLRSSDVSKLGKGILKELPDRSKKYIFSVCEELWRSGYLEESFIACILTESVRKSFVKEDIEIFEEWIEKYVTNWASCDTFCNHSVGELVMKYTETISYLKKWALSKNRWMRRASAVSLIIPAKRGLFLPDIFEIATLLLKDSDDMVQKGYGWLLKVASISHLNEVYEFVIRNRPVMPRTALRYAIEKMPAELKSAAMQK